MTHYFKYTAALIFIALIVCNGFAQKRVEQAVENAERPKLTLGGEKHVLVLNENQPPGMRLHQGQFVAKPVMGVPQSEPPTCDISKLQLSAYPVSSLQDTDMLRKLQDPHLMGYQLYPRYWKNLADLLPRYRFNF